MSETYSEGSAEANYKEKVQSWLHQQHRQGMSTRNVGSDTSSSSWTPTSSSASSPKGPPKGKAAAKKTSSESSWSSLSSDSAEAEVPNIEEEIVDAEAEETETFFEMNDLKINMGSEELQIASTLAQEQNLKTRSGKEFDLMSFINLYLAEPVCDVNGEA